MKILLNILTHGDERIGLRVAKELGKLKIDRKVFIVQIANEKAYKLNKRFVDQDLNRSFPGKRNGNHEQKLAYKLLPIVKSADLVIDVHSTSSDLKDAVIVTKLDKRMRKYIDIISPKYTLVMSATQKSTLISRAKVGIAFEYGKDNDSVVLKKIVRDIKKLLKFFGLIEFVSPTKKMKTRYFDVFAKIDKPVGYKPLKKIKNYKLVRRGERFARKGNNYLVAKHDFYPILFGERTYKDYFGFGGKKLK